MGKGGWNDGISAEILKSIPWRALQKIIKAFRLRYLGLNEQRRNWGVAEEHHCAYSQEKDGGICIQSVLAKFVLWMPLFCAGNGAGRRRGKRQELGRYTQLWVRRRKKCDGNLECHSTLGSSSSKREWWPELGFVTYSLGVKQASDNVSPENLSLVMKEMGIDPILASGFWESRLEASMTLAPRKQGSLEYLLTVPSNTEGRRVRAYSTWWWGVSSGQCKKNGKTCGWYQDKRKWKWSRRGKSESHDLRW